MFCPQCRATCLEDAKYCHKCGATLPTDKGPSAPHPVQEPETTANVAQDSSGDGSGFIAKGIFAGVLVGILLSGSAPGGAANPVANFFAYKVVIGLVGAVV